MYIKQNGLYFVITTRRNVSPTFSLELLNRIAKVGILRSSTTGAFLTARADFQGLLRRRYRRGYSQELCAHLRAPGRDSGLRLRAEHHYRDPEGVRVQRSCDCRCYHARQLRREDDCTRTRALFCGTDSLNRQHANLKTTPSHSANKPVQLADSRSGILKTKEEIFVDLIERQTVLFSAGVCDASSLWPKA